jgi:hypothetical protein
MRRVLEFVLLGGLFWLRVSPSVICQEPPGDLRARAGAVVAEAYQAAAAGFPCKVRTGGKPKMLRWQDVDRCVNEAAARVDWTAISTRLKELRASADRIPASEFENVVEAALDAQALTYDKLFVVKNTNVLLPLTHSVLKCLPADSLQDLPVFDRRGTEVGTFAGAFPYERTGGLATANTYRLMLFQYKDRSGNIQSPSDKLLLDSFGVPWKDAMSERGFRLPLERLTLGRE